MRKSVRAAIAREQDRRAGQIIRQLGIQRAMDEAPKGYAVSLGNSMPGTAYLIEYRYFPDEASELRAMTARELVEFLSSNIEHAHHSGDESELIGIWRWDGPGKLAKLVMNSRAGHTDDNDWIHSAYVLREERETAKVDLAFTVRIDGRA